MYLRLDSGKENLGLMQLINKKGRSPNEKDMKKAEILIPIITAFLKLTTHLNRTQEHIGSIQLSLKKLESEIVSTLKEE